MQLRYRHLTVPDLCNHYVVELPDGKWGFAKFTIAATMIMGLGLDTEAELIRLISQLYPNDTYTLLFDGDVMLLRDPSKMYITYPFNASLQVPMTEFAAKSVDLQNYNNMRPIDLYRPVKNTNKTCICIGPRARDCKAHD